MARNMSQDQVPNVMIVASHPIQHFCPLYRSLTGSSILNLRVIFGSTAGAVPYTDPAYQVEIKWQSDLLSGFEYEFVAEASKQALDKSVPASNLEERLDAFDPDIVQIYGLNHGLSRRAYWWAVKRRRKLLYFADSELRQERSMLTMLRKHLTLRPLFCGVDAFLTIGDCNEAYYAAFGVPRRKFFRSPYPIDSGAINKALLKKAVIRSQIRARLSIPEDSIVFLIVGKLTERKRPLDAVDAVMALDEPTRRRSWVVFAGDGPLRAEITKRVAERGDSPISIAGFVDVEELPSYYIASDVLLHLSSSDPHPLAVGEAITAGLPVIASDRLGCIGETDDLREGENAIVYKCADVSAISVAMARVVSESRLIENMSAASIRIAGDRSLEISTRGYLAAATALSQSNRLRGNRATD